MICRFFLDEWGFVKRPMEQSMHATLDNTADWPARIIISRMMNYGFIMPDRAVIDEMLGVGEVSDAG